MQNFIEIPVAGEKLAACFHRPSPGRLIEGSPVVVCCHGLTGTRVGSCYRLVTLARQLVACNIACLRFDFRGCGESDGRFQDLTPERLVEDLNAALATVENLPGCDPTRIGILASSFGAFTAAQAVEDLSALRCLVFLAPVADARSLIDRAMTRETREFLDEHGWIDHRGLPLGRGFLEGVPETSAPDMLALRPRPLLIFHSEGDREVPVEQASAYEAAMTRAGAEVRFDRLNTGDHGMRDMASNARIIKGSVDWFRRFLHPELSSESTA